MKSVQAKLQQLLIYCMSNITGSLNARLSLFFCKQLWFSLVECYGISTLVGYLIPNPFYTYIYIYIYIYIYNDLVGFYGYQPL